MCRPGVWVSNIPAGMYPDWCCNIRQANASNLVADTYERVDQRNGTGIGEASKQSFRSSPMLSGFHAEGANGLPPGGN